jgi:mycothiol synthase
MDADSSRLRPYRPDDLPRIVDLINAADAVDQVERFASLDELRLKFSEPGFDPEHNAFVVESPNSQLSGYGRLHLRPGPTETSFYTSGVVHPDWRRRGVGRLILKRLWQRATERLDEVEHGPVYFQGNARLSEAGHIALYESFGMTVARYFIRMTYAPLTDDLPEPQVPDGITLRGFDPERDSRPTWASLNEAFTDHWGYVPTPWEVWEHWMNSDFFRPELHVIAAAGDEIVGACMNLIDPTRIARLGRRDGYIDDLAVQRPYRRRGIGRALLLASLRILRDQGMESATLDADSENLTGATRLYEAVGFRVVQRSALYRKTIE